ncbi:hypothetical protein FrCorBMG51_04180 [Protofrankia coriariae]|uniref:Uncharacterized protein n=1 Tax=Protofrankia coriariae TaxID=1562887 RepID=A0ABR5F6X4_9ACTN|nr:hypothetical protein FrCorBMG51_04180 [Protofrankia coriariae]
MRPCAQPAQQPGGPRSGEGAVEYRADRCGITPFHLDEEIPGHFRRGQRARLRGLVPQEVEESAERDPAIADLGVHQPPDDVGIDRTEREGVDIARRQPVGAGAGTCGGHRRRGPHQ